MKRAMLVAGATAAIGASGAVPAQAGVTWRSLPSSSSRCRNVGCLQRQVNRLTSILKIDTKYMAILANCLSEVPVSDYGDQSGGTFGYVYDNGDGTSQDTSAMDVTNPGTQVGAWMMTDSCNAQPGPNVAHLAMSTRMSAAAVFGTAPTGRIARERTLTPTRR